MSCDSLSIKQINHAGIITIYIDYLLANPTLLITNVSHCKINHDQPPFTVINHKPWTDISHKPSAVITNNQPLTINHPSGPTKLNHGLSLNHRSVSINRPESHPPSPPSATIQHHCPPRHPPFIRHGTSLRARTAPELRSSAWGGKGVIRAHDSHRMPRLPHESDPANRVNRAHRPVGWGEMSTYAPTPPAHRIPHLPHERKDVRVTAKGYKRSPHNPCTRDVSTRPL